MKLLTKILVLSLFFIVGCGINSQNQIQYTGITYLPQLSSFDKIVVESRGYAKRKNELSPAAAKTAMEGLLFQGIADSPYSRPIIKDPETNQKHTLFWQNFWEEDVFSRFVVHAVPLFQPARDKSSNRYQQMYRITINTKSLKAHLESEGIILRFGL